jgi:hypothetical protein
MIKKKPKNAKLDEDGYPVFNPAEFESLSTQDKDRVWAYYNRKIPRSETRAPTPAEQAQLDRALGRRPGRPKIGQGAKVVAVTMEKGFLGRVDAYAKKHSLKRAEMITRGLRLVMGE